MATIFNLCRVLGVLSAWETEHRIYSLEVNGFCCVNTYLEAILSSEPGEYRKLLKVLKLIGGNTRVRNPLHVKSHADHSGIYEVVAHGGNSRISFFYDSPPEENVICILTYWEKFAHKHKQDTFFQKSVEIMNCYRFSR